jgi:hypothetical protein
MSKRTYARVPHTHHDVQLLEARAGIRPSLAHESVVLVLLHHGFL